MRVAEWIITFDDGPMPADFYEVDDRSESDMLDPLNRILATLAKYPLQSIPAVFFLRGPAYPWSLAPPDSWYAHGVDAIEQAGHYAELHCYRHDPELWGGWVFQRKGAISKDLDDALRFFESKSQRQIQSFRPPYGQGGFEAFDWAKRNNLKYHKWKIDTEDWRHHRDADYFGLRAFENDPDGHLKHIKAMTSFQIELELLSEGSATRDILMHVSDRTSRHLTEILDTICETTTQCGYDSRYIVPGSYIS